MSSRDKEELAKNLAELIRTSAEGALNQLGVILPDIRPQAFLSPPVSYGAGAGSSSWVGNDPAGARRPGCISCGGTRQSLNVDT